MRNSILNLPSSLRNFRCSWQTLCCRLIWLCGAVSLVLALGLVYRAVTGPSRLLTASKVHAKQQAERAATQLSQKLAVLVPVAQGLAQDLSAEALPPRAVEDRLRTTLAAHGEIFRIGVAYSPYAATPDRRLYAPYAIRQQDALHLMYIEDAYDYTQPDNPDGPGPRTAWYHRPLADGAGWLEPYFGTASNAWLATYAVPFYRPSAASNAQTPIGVVAVDFSLADIRHMAGALDLDYPGYRLILSQQGTLLAHPFPAYLGRSLAEVAAQDMVLDMLRDHVAPGQYTAVYNPATGQAAWVVFTPIPLTPWIIGVVFTEEGVFRQTEHMLRRQRLTAGLAVLAFLWWLIMLVTRAYRGDMYRLWSAAVAFAVCCGLGIGWIWLLTVTATFDTSQQQVVVLDQIGVEAALYQHIAAHPQILTPEFAAYSRRHPAAMPGVAPNFVTAGWDLQQSFFSYRFNTYNTTFGLQRTAWQDTMPELYFNMSLRRDILGPFIVDMIPLLSVAFLVFAVLLIATRREQLVNIFGFNTATVLAYCAALLFVLTVAHANLRDKLAAHGIIYLENFYFVMYFAILAESINAIAFASTLNIRFIHSHDNLFVKLLYRPVILGLLLGLTVSFFY